MSVVLAVVLQAFPSRHTRHRGAVRREATTAPKIHARPIFRMALSEGNPEPSPQACLSTCGTWPLHLEDHVNCLHRCFTQCWIKAGAPESAKSYSGGDSAHKEDLGSYGSHARPHPFLPRGLFLHAPYAARLRWWRASGGCSLPPRDTLLGGDPR